MYRIKIDLNKVNGSNVEKIYRTQQRLQFCLTLVLKVSPALMKAWLSLHSLSWKMGSLFRMEYQQPQVVSLHTNSRICCTSKNDKSIQKRFCRNVQVFATQTRRSYCNYWRHFENQRNAFLWLHIASSLKGKDNLEPPKFSLKSYTIQVFETSEVLSASNLRAHLSDLRSFAYGVDFNCIQTYFTVTADGTAVMAKMANSSVRTRFTKQSQTWMRFHVHE